jgi:hypothetical protein
MYVLPRMRAVGGVWPLHCQNNNSNLASLSGAVNPGSPDGNVNHVESNVSLVLFLTLSTMLSQLHMKPCIYFSSQRSQFLFGLQHTF